jgi:hypothetical protein
VQAVRVLVAAALRLALWITETDPDVCRERESIIPFGGTGYIVHFEVVDDLVVVGAVRHQREDDDRH